MSDVRVEEVDQMVDGTHLTGIFASPVKPGPGVLLLHAWWGLNPFFKDLASWLAGDGFTVFAPDLRKGQIARSIQEAEALENGSDFENTLAVIQAAVSLLQERLAGPGQAADRIRLALIGFSMGGSWSLHFAANMPEVFSAVVLYYAAEEVDYSKIRASLQGHFAEQDEYSPPEVVQQMENALRAAGLRTEFHQYPGTGHWFMETDRPDAYNQAAADLAYQRTVAFLKKELSAA